MGGRPSAAPLGRLLERIEGSPHLFGLLAVGLATALGLGLRATMASQSLFGDELFTYPIVSQSSLGAVFDGLEVTENTPPLFYILSWLSAKLGSDPNLIRLPSVLLGAAAIPMTYLLTARVAAWFAAGVAAFLMALAPIALFYGSDARAYAVLLFLLPLSTYSLIRASDDGGAGWWVAFFAATAAASLRRP